MKKSLVLPIFLLISFSPATAMEKKVVEQSYFHKIKEAFSDTIECISYSCGAKMLDDVTPEEQEKFDIDPIKDLRTLYNIIHSTAVGTIDKCLFPKFNPYQKGERK